MLMAMPSAKGLFHKAIVQSGSLMEVAEPVRSRQLAAETLKALGIGRGELDRLAQVSALDLVKAGETARKAMPRPASGIGLVWQPTGDGATIPADPWAGAPLVSKDVSMIIGATLNEYAPSLGNAALEDMGWDQATAMAKGAGVADGAWAAARAAGAKLKPVEVLSRAVSRRFGLPAMLQAELKATAQGAAPAFLYRFDFNSGVLDGRARAYHCAELAYCFDNVERCLNATGGTPAARKLAGQMADAWIAFARTGDPNHKGLPRWPAVDRAHPVEMRFDDPCGVFPAR